jgi:hypothetical protein
MSKPLMYLLAFAIVSHFMYPPRTEQADREPCEAHPHAAGNALTDEEFYRWSN